MLPGNSATHFAPASKRIGAGESTRAFAGGINLILAPHGTVGFSEVGIAGLIKTALSLHRRAIPASLPAAELNPVLDAEPSTSTRPLSSRDTGGGGATGCLRR
jgi:acyl transferase domain-containing protein